jgi:hypothetical protein
LIGPRVGRVGRHPRGAGAAVAVMLSLAAVVLPAAGCSSRWRAVARTHVELLEQTGSDAIDAYVSPRAALEPGDIERLRYPLDRARGFASASRERFQSAPWLDRFDDVLRTYAEVADWLDRARTQPIGDAERAHAGELSQRLRDAAAAANAALAPSGI